MGILIARYALGLLANPKTCQVAGLNPVLFVSIAAPHLGCCSDHPEEVRCCFACYVALFVVFDRSCVASLQLLYSLFAKCIICAHWEQQLPIAGARSAAASCQKLAESTQLG
jgi:hypothetical protein